MIGVYIGCPTYSEDICADTARSIWHTASARDDVRVIAATRSCSLIPGSCNALWCQAINLREEHDLKWFAMLHADVVPDHWWIDTLMQEAEEHEADMISACVPIKDTRGLTSTAIASGDERSQFCRITMSQLHHPDFPDTFDIDGAADALESLPGELRIESVPRVGLRLNTGCFMARLDRPWVGCDPATVYFENLDWIEKTADGWRQRDISEDWRFSQRMQDAGGRLAATKRVRCTHKGIASFPGGVAWGSVSSDAQALTMETA